MMINNLPPMSMITGLEAEALGELYAHLDAEDLVVRVAERIRRLTHADQITIRSGDRTMAVAPKGPLIESADMAEIPVARSGFVVTVHPASAVSDEASLFAYLNWADVALAYGRLSQSSQASHEDAKLHVMTDPLTTLGSKALFIQRLDAEFAESRRYRYPLTVMVADIDGFRRINDTFGREVADAVLARIGEILRRCVRHCDLPARIGGEEFAIVLPHTDELGAHVLAERIREAIASESFQNPAGSRFQVTVSLGLSMLRRKHQTPTQLIESADRSMLQAKEHGGNQVCSASPIDFSAPPTLSHQPRQATMEMAKALEIAMHAKDPLTGGHARAVGVYSKLVAEALGMPPERQEFIFFAGLLHDVGKLAIPDEILKKAGPLNEAEWAFMKRHPVIAANMINRLQGFAPLHDPILYHHERWDGRGYPEGIPGDLIPIEARIITVCDSYDAMTRQRCYTQARSHEEAIAELLRCAGTQFDASLVEVFIALDLPNPLSIKLESFLG